MGAFEVTPEGFRIFSTTISRPIAYTYILSVMYNVTFFMQFVSTPYLVKALGISDSDNGLIQTFFGLLQMIGGPIYGYFIQKWGIRHSLFLCYGSTLLSGVLLFFATDLTTLILSRLPVLFMHGQQGHQTLLSALTEPGKERTNAFGRMGLTFGIGFVFTPIFSIIATKLFGERAPLLVSATMCIIPFIVLDRLIPKEAYEKKTPSKEDSDTEHEHATMNFTNIVKILNRYGIVNVLLKKNAPILPCLMTFAIMQLYMINEFKIQSEWSHVTQLVVGIYIMLSNGFGVIWLRQKFDEQTLLKIGMTSFSAGFLLFFCFHSFWMFFIIMPFIALGMSLVATVADSLLTSLVDEKEQGLVLGISTSFNSLVRTFAPVVSGCIMDTYGFMMFPLIGTLLTVLGHVLLFTWPLDNDKIHKTKKE